MKIYLIDYKLEQRSPKTISIPTHSAFKIGIDVIQNGESQPVSDIQLFKNNIEITADETDFHGYKTFTISDAAKGCTEYIVKYYEAEMKLNIVGTNIKEIELTDAVGSYTLPTATTERLGGIKVGANLTALADGTLQAEGIPSEIECYALSADNIINTMELCCVGGGAYANYATVSNLTATTATLGDAGLDQGDSSGYLRISRTKSNNNEDMTLMVLDTTNTEYNFSGPNFRFESNLGGTDTYASFGEMVHGAGLGVEFESDGSGSQMCQASLNQLTCDQYASFSGTLAGPGDVLYATEDGSGRFIARFGDIYNGGVGLEYDGQNNTLNGVVTDLTATQIVVDDINIDGYTKTISIEDTLNSITATMYGDHFAVDNGRCVTSLKPEYLEVNDGGATALYGLDYMVLQNGNLGTLRFEPQSVTINGVSYIMLVGAQI